MTHPTVLFTRKAQKTPWGYIRKPVDNLCSKLENLFKQFHCLELRQM